MKDIFSYNADIEKTAFEEIGDCLNLIASDYIEKATFVPD